MFKRARNVALAFVAVIVAASAIAGALALYLLLAVGIPVLYIGAVVFAVVWVLKLTGIL